MSKTVRRFLIENAEDVQALALSPDQADLFKHLAHMVMPLGVEALVKQLGRPRADVGIDLGHLERTGYITRGLVGGEYRYTANDIDATPCDLSETLDSVQKEVLLWLRERHPLERTTEGVSHGIGMPRTRVSRALCSLERLGFVARNEFDQWSLINAND